MYRFSRTVTLKQMAFMPEAVKFASSIVEHLRKEYGWGTVVGSEVYGHPRLHWFTDFETLEKMAQAQGKMSQDKTYWSLLDSAKHLWVDGSVHDRLVKMM